MHRALDMLEPRRLFAVRYVDLNSAGPLHDGTAWETAYTDLQQALSTAISGDEIRIADGIYKPTVGTDRSVSFVLRPGVQVNGGYAGIGSVNPNTRDLNVFQTVLSGNIGSESDAQDNSYHVVVSNVTNATLDGVTISGGRADGSTDAQNGGGGIYITAGNTVLTNCVVIDNYGIRSAGMHAQGAAVDATIGYTTFKQNVSPAGDGAGARSADGALTTFISCTFEGNSTTSGSGGGLYLQGSSTVQNCTFRGNVAHRGGAMAFAGENVQLNISNSSFLANSAVEGGAMYVGSTWPLIYQCTFIGNTAQTVGGALYWQTSGGGVANCVFTQNHAATGGGAIYGVSSTAAVFSNCIIWGNTSPVGSQVYHSFSLTVRNSDVQGGWVGTGNISTNPLFVRDPSIGADGQWGTSDDDYGNLRLKPNSPCIDAGDSSAVPLGISIDLEGNSRFVDIPGVLDTGAKVDIGTYERQLPLSAAAGVFNIDQHSIQFTFNNNLQATSLSMGDAIIQRVLADGSLAPAAGAIGVTYDSATKTATFVLPVNLPNGNYRATMTSGSVIDTYDRILADAVSRDFFILAGDATRDRVVDARDLVVLSSHWLSHGVPFSQGDFDYNGVVDQADLSLMAQNWQGIVLPPPPPPLPPVSFNPVSTIAPRAGIRTPVRTIGLVV